MATLYEPTAVEESLQDLGWCVWKYVEKPDNPGKPFKVPFDLKGKRLSKSDPEGWLSWEDVKDVEQKGFRLSKGGNRSVIDLDKVRDPETGEIDPWAEELVEELMTYTEVSPSGTGLHLVMCGEKPEGGRTKFDYKGHRIEVYSHDHYLTYTGDTLDFLDIIKSGHEWLDANVPVDNSRETKVIHDPATLSVDDEKIVRDLSAVPYKNDVFNKLFHAGDWESLGIPSASEADLTLLNKLAWATKDPDQIDRIFRSSGLYREKWDREDYRSKSIDKALSFNKGHMYANRSGGDYKRKIDALYGYLFGAQWEGYPDFLIYQSLLEIARREGFGSNNVGILMFASSRDIEMITGLNPETISRRINKMNVIPDSPIKIREKGDLMNATRFLLPYPNTHIHNNVSISYSACIYPPLVNYQPLTPKQKVALNLILAFPDMTTKELQRRMGARGTLKDFKKGTTDHLKTYIKVDGKGFINTRKGIEDILESNVDTKRLDEVAEEVADERREHLDIHLHGKMYDWMESLAKVGVKT